MKNKKTVKRNLTKFFLLPVSLVLTGTIAIPLAVSLSSINKINPTTNRFEAIKQSNEIILKPNPSNTTNYANALIAYKLASYLPTKINLELSKTNFANLLPSQAKNDFVLQDELYPTNSAPTKTPSLLQTLILKQILLTLQPYLTKLTENGVSFNKNLLSVQWSGETNNLNSDTNQSIVVNVYYDNYIVLLNNKNFVVQVNGFQSFNDLLVKKINALGVNLSLGNPNLTVSVFLNNKEATQILINNLINKIGSINNQVISPNDIHLSIISNSINNELGEFKVFVTIGNNPNILKIQNGNPITITGFKKVQPVSHNKPKENTPNISIRDFYQAVANKIASFGNILELGNNSETPTQALENPNTISQLLGSILNLLNVQGGVNQHPVTYQELHVSFVNDSANQSKGTIAITISVGSNNDIVNVNNGQPIIISGYKIVKQETHPLQKTPSPTINPPEHKPTSIKPTSSNHKTETSKPEHTEPDPNSSKPIDNHQPPLNNSSPNKENPDKTQSPTSNPDQNKPVEPDTPTPSQPNSSSSNNQVIYQLIANKISALGQTLNIGNPNEAAQIAINNPNTPQTITNKIIQLIGSINGREINPNLIHVIIVSQSANANGELEINVSVGLENPYLPVNSTPIIINGYKKVQMAIATNPNPEVPANYKNQKSGLSITDKIMLGIFLGALPVSALVAFGIWFFLNKKNKQNP